MFSQTPQDGRQAVSGMHIQPNMNQQMQMQMNQPQQAGMQQPGMQQQGMQQPGMQQPGMQQQGMQQPGMQQQGMQQQGIQQQVMQQQGMQQQGMQQQGMQQQSMQQQGMQQQGMQQQGMQQQGMQQQGMQQQGMQQQGMQQSGMQQASIQQQPGMQQPGMQQPGMQQPGMQQPGMQQPGMQQPSMQQPGMQQSSMQQPGMQHTRVQQPGIPSNVSGMSIVNSNVHPGSGQMPRMSSIGMQHSVKSEAGANMQAGNASVAMQRMPQPQGASQPVKPEGYISSAQQHDRIIKFKQLLPQLRECLVDLIAIAQSNFAANAALDNRDKSINTSSIPRFDKALEQFFSICNMIQRHLSIAHDQLSHALHSMQYTPITVNQMRDGANPNAFGAYVETVQQQLTFAKEIQNMLLETSDRIMKRHSMIQPHVTTPKRPQF